MKFKNSKGVETTLNSQQIDALCESINKNILWITENNQVFVNCTWVGTIIEY